MLYILSFCYRPKVPVLDASKEKPIFNKSEFGARKNLLIKEGYFQNLFSNLKRV